MDSTIRTIQVPTYIGQNHSQIGSVSVKEKEASLPDDTVQITKHKAVNEKKAPSVKVTILPHDPNVASPEVINFSKDKIGDKIAGPKMYAIDLANPKAIPDLEGNYLYELGTPQFDQLTSYTTAYRTLDLWESIKGTPVKWAFSNPQLGVNAHKKEGMNAYYSRNEASANFFYFNSPALGKVVQTSQSPDIVAHEIGHAVLDGLRPGYLGWDTETMSVHEAFADTSSMLFALKTESNVDKILKENGGDFSKPSLISRLGEEFGKAIVLSDNDPSNDDRDYLRSMLNNFKYVDPSTLPSKAPENQLANECHSFSRVFSGASYDILGDIYDSNIASGMSKEKALTGAGDELGKLFMKSVEMAPSNRCKYKDVALGMLKADMKENNGKYADTLKNVFMDRNILSSKDVELMQAHMEKIPSFRLEAKASDADIAKNIIASYGKEFGVPDGTVFSMENSEAENIYGGKTINLGCSEELQLKGDRFGKYDGFYVDAKGGLKLEFDQNGNLADFHFDAIDNDKKEDVMSGVADAIRNNLVREEGVKAEEYSSKFTAQVVSTDDGRKKIERIPIIVM